MTDQRINVQTSFNANFCWELEYHLTEALINSAENRWETFWCDGICEPTINEHFTERDITSIKQISTVAWIGKGPCRQYKCQMIIMLGRRSRRKALRGLDISSCLPDVEMDDWFEVDVSNELVIIHLH